jgi:hypothetical protein
MNDWTEKELTPQLEETEEQIGKIQSLNEFEIVSQAF